MQWYFYLCTWYAEKHVQNVAWFACTGLAWKMGRDDFSISSLRGQKIRCELQAIANIMSTVFWSVLKWLWGSLTFTYIWPYQVNNYRHEQWYCGEGAARSRIIFFFLGGGVMIRLLSRHICSAGRPKKIAESGHVLKFSQQKIIIILYLWNKKIDCFAYSALCSLANFGMLYVFRPEPEQNPFFIQSRGLKLTIRMWIGN
jgi:hypothetical protein